MEKITEILQQTYYGDVRYEKNSVTLVSKNKSEESISQRTYEGLCVRVISDNRWHYLGFDNLNDEEKILSEVETLVRRIGNKKSLIWIQKGWELEKSAKMKEDPEGISIEEKMKVIRDIFKNGMKNKMVANFGVGMGHSKSETFFMNTEGSVLRQTLPFFRFSMSATTKEGRNLENDYYVEAKQGGYEIFRKIDVEKEMEEMVKSAIDMLHAKQVKGGVYDIIIDPEISGVVAHESFGHGLEADQVMRNRSYLAPLAGKKIISELVSIHDNSSMEGERGFFFFDDEGIKSRDNILVEKGVLKGFIHDRQSAAFMESEPTGNARAQDFTRKVFARMSNTYISPGDWDVEEMIEDTDSGYYLIKNLTGMEDPLGGNMQLVTHKAKEIKNGELIGLFKGVSISGKVLEFLNNVDAVGKDFDIKGGGCGKGKEDYVSVTTGGPHMRIRKAIIG